jgi:superfamily I DNA/RNA helicase
MTLHSSKGLEFQAVIMMGLEAGVFPSGYDKTEEQLEEAKRLFYVGCYARQDPGTPDVRL